MLHCSSPSSSKHWYDQQWLEQPTWTHTHRQYSLIWWHTNRAAMPLPLTLAVWAVEQSPSVVLHVEQLAFDVLHQAAKQLSTYCAPPFGYWETIMGMCKVYLVYPLCPCVCVWLEVQTADLALWGSNVSRLLSGIVGLLVVSVAVCKVTVSDVICSCFPADL